MKVTSDEDSRTIIGGGDTRALKAVRDKNGIEGWPGIVSRFELAIIAGRRSKQLFQGAQPRIPVDPLKRRNTSIALEELKRGLVAFRGQNGNKPQTFSPADDTIRNTTVGEHASHLDLRKAE